ncbi:MAG: radical SAM protein [Desulfovibrio sp.]|nr:radical SAM protein [Desulfovibrio sp.]
MDTPYTFMRDEDREFPPMVIVDFTNVCNLRCVHCAHPVIKKEAGYKPAFMKKELFKKIVDETAGRDILLMRIASDGESLLHPDFFEMMHMAKDAGVAPVNLTTNGMLLTPETSRRLVDCGLDIVDVSIDAHSKDIYEQIRRGGNYDTVVANTLGLVQARNEAGSSMRIFVSIIRQPLNAHQIEDFKAFWEPRVDFVLVRNLCDEVGLVDIEPVESVAVPEVRWPCPQFWKRITITHSGDVRYCVEDWRNITVIGNVGRQSIAEIWQGETYQRLRERQLKGDYRGMALCEDCKDWATAPWDFGYDRIVRETTRPK